MSQQQISYRKRIDRVVNYIYDHLDEPIDLQHLADVACMSPYHWHRVYRAIQGETIAATVKRLRLHRAAGQLAQSKISIEEIAERSGYCSLAAFTRAFTQVYGQPPAQYRRAGSHTRLQSAIERGEGQLFPVEIKTIEPMTLIGLPHQGDYMNIGRVFEPVFGWMGQAGLLPQMRHAMATYYDDPDSVPEADLRSFAGAVFAATVDVPDHFESRTIEGGRYAVLRYRGAYAEMSTAYRWLYGTWLNNSGVELRDAPCVEDYLNNPREVAPSELLTDIYMPLADE
ncbi:AraC family transcriptional regulator [Maritalea mediterranea]|uniref:AraC family transcriptional regulator n=1 Tax=Maritalea mediterranea TaxID=2909667 RepID=A0ABS9E8E9_9HYPH|nr:AraC family transcriptional regulator [Maritalea mediterranea]MCF4099122.1 AraC family transcriptional regulator [Maritalea mediterranea]